jgi:hypothetical protein
MICATTDELVFLPVQLAGLPPSLDVKVGGTALLAVQADRLLLTPLQVTVTPLKPSVSLNGKPAGQPLMVMVPTSGVSPTFAVTGAASSNLNLSLEARGVQTGHVSGVVNP